MADSVSSFELHKKFSEAVKSGRFMITVSTFDPEKKKIDHYLSTKGFPRADMIPTLEQLAALALPETEIDAADNS